MSNSFEEKQISEIINAVNEAPHLAKYIYTQFKKQPHLVEEAKRRIMKGDCTKMTQTKEKQQFEDEDFTEDEGQREISKIKYDGSQIEIHYHESDGKFGFSETVFKHSDQPASSFLDAVHSLTDPFLSMLELPEEYADNMEIRGITVSGGGAVITAVKKFPDLGNKALCLNTPHMVFAENKQNEYTIAIPVMAEKAVKKLIEEAELYLDGKRHVNQLKLVTTETAA